MMWRFFIDAYIALGLVWRPNALLGVRSMQPGCCRTIVATFIASLFALAFMACGAEDAQVGRPAVTADLSAPVASAVEVGAGPAARSAAASGPNILWVVWDTVRADRMSVYGYPRPTTPKLEAWAVKARVFENVVSTASSTVPSHAAMFTGLLPSEHGANNGHRWLDVGHFTVAERLSEAGYQTFLWAANPHIAKEENFQQGFDVEYHPWDPETLDEAIRIVTEKAVGDRSARSMSRRKGAEEVKPWATKAAGELAERRLLDWLSRGDSKRPWFAFINYMEAHRPFIPSREARQKMMGEKDVGRSYKVDRSWAPMWSFVFGLHEYSPKELKIMASTYDATLTELDLLFDHLLDSLERRGSLENTVIILTADHGEHLGEHHMLDHQYALYRPLINVPLVIYYPERFEAGRDTSPVMNFDLFPTILELAGVALDLDEEQASKAQSLLRTTSGRQRMSQYPEVFTEPFRAVQKKHPDWDPTPWHSRLYALQDGRFKIICGKAAGPELYDVDGDPGEVRNSASVDPARAESMSEALHEFLASTRVYEPAVGDAVEMTPEHRERLEALGYVISDVEVEAGSRVRASLTPCTPL
jgi:arylsulfatase A-like enzyme